MTRVGVLLSGCGVQDGSEIHEAVLTLLALDEAGAETICLAPNKDQARVVDHSRTEETKERRNCLVEAARIARGKIRDVATVSSDELDAIILPGGYGAALNLCDFAQKGSRCSVDPGVRKLLVDMHSSGKPIGAICIAPAVLAAVLGSEHPRLTIGTDKQTAETLSAMGVRHQPCAVDQHIVDEENRLVTSPAYMLAGSIKELRIGIVKTVEEVLRMAEAPALAR